MANQKRLLPKIASEGYCCEYGYLKLCRARGETRREMAGFLGVKFRLIKHWYSLLKKGKVECQCYSDCLRPVIEDIENSTRGLLDNSDSLGATGGINKLDSGG